MGEWVSPQIYGWVILPLIIFLARICDVSLGTLRIIVVSRGMKFFAAVLGFFEVLIWITVIGQIMNGVSGMGYYLAYAMGFAVGNYVGITLEGRLAMGLVAVRMITGEDAEDMMQAFRNHRYGITSMGARGVSGEVRLLFTIVPRKKLPQVISLIQKHHPGAFLSVEEVKIARNGVFPVSEITSRIRFFSGLRRKGK